MARSEVLSLLVLILLFQGYQVRGIQNPGQNQQVSSVVGCNVELVWEWPNKASTVSVSKIQNSQTIELRIESNNKYRIDRTTDKLSMIMYNVTMADTAVYRSEYKGGPKQNTELTVMDFRWENVIRTKYVRVGETMTLLWTFVTKFPAKLIRLHRKLPSTNGAPPQDLVRWENGVKKTLIADDRMMYGFGTVGDEDTYRVNFTIRDTTIDDLKYVYNIEVKFNDHCLKTAEPVELMEDFDFEWLPSPNPVKSTINKPVELVWKYHSLKLANKIIFNRYNNLTKERKQLGIWDIEKGFESKEGGIEFKKSNTNQEETIIMTIQIVTDKEFDRFYECRIFCGILFNSVSGIELQAELPHISSDTPVIKSRPTENTTFVWYFKYKFPVLWVTLTRSNISDGEDNQIGFIYNKILSLRLPGKDGNRIHANVTEEEESGYINGQITLSLLNTTKDDFSYKYYVCRIAFKDKQSSERHSIILEEKDVAGSDVTDKEVASMSSGVIAAIVVVLIVGIGILCLILYLLKYRTKKKGGDILPPGFMKYPHYRVWVKNSNDVLNEIEKNIYKVARQFLGDHIINDLTSESLQNVAKASKRNSAIQLMDLLVKQGENVLPKIITSLINCGLTNIGHKLQTDLERSQRMKDEDYKLWAENYLGLVDGLMNALPNITLKLSERKIIDSSDLADLDIHRAIGKREGAIKLVNILCQRGRDVLSDINSTLKACELPKIERVNGVGDRPTPMKYDHYIVWIKHKTYLMESFNGKLSDIAEKLVQNKILDEGKRTEIMKNVKENESKGAYKLVDMVCGCGELVLPKIIQILKDLALSEVVKKLEIDLSRTGRMNDNDYRVWVNNGTYIVTNIHYNLHIVSKKLLEKNIIDDVDMKEFDSHRQIGRRLGAVKLVDILSERGEDVLGKIIDTFGKCGFKKIADELKKDLSRRVRMIDWHYEIWKKKKRYLTDNMKDKLPCLTRELYGADIIDMVDWEEIENAGKESKENGAEILEDILCNRGENVLPGLLLVFNRCGLFDVVEALKEDINRHERMKYTHFKIWNKNKEYLITSFRNNLAVLMEELKNVNIIDKDGVTELRRAEESDGAKKLVDMLDKRGKDVLPKIIEVLNKCHLTDVATKLTTDISRLEKMDPMHYEIWEKRYNYLVGYFKDNLDRLTEELIDADNIIDDEDRENILSGSKEDGAKKLIDTLGYRGKDILPKIIEVLESCGLSEVAVELEKDLSTDDNDHSDGVTEHTPLIDTDTQQVSVNMQPN